MTISPELRQYIIDRAVVKVSEETRKKVGAALDHGRLDLGGISVNYQLQLAFGDLYNEGLLINNARKLVNPAVEVEKKRKWWPFG